VALGVTHKPNSDRRAHFSFGFLRPAFFSFRFRFLFVPPVLLLFFHLFSFSFFFPFFAADSDLKKKRTRKIEPEKKETKLPAQEECLFSKNKIKRMKNEK
jgi:hypothetical protein